MDDKIKQKLIGAGAVFGVSALLWLVFTAYTMIRTDGYNTAQTSCTNVVVPATAVQYYCKAEAELASRGQPFVGANNTTYVIIPASSFRPECFQGFRQS